jgi:asparagine synthase (glutamine-hydrolysing)
MWAFALWDASEERLILGRDHLGIKPLYYHINEDFLAFASEIRALLILPSFKSKPYEKAIYDYLVDGRVDHTEETFFQGISRLMPGHYVTYTLSGSLQKTRYWKMPTISGADGEDMRKASQEVRDLFVGAVRRRIISGVPVGTCLSGGLDSSSIIAVVNRLENATKKSVGKRLQAFSAMCPGDPIDESYFDNVAAKASSTEVNSVYPTASGLWNDLQELIRTQEEPFSSTSIYAQWKVMQKARDIPVLLDGQGGDELFAGYIEYFKPYIAELLKGRKIRAALKEISCSLDLTPLSFLCSFNYGQS